MREAALSWTEAYPAMEYRHGPISITGPDRHLDARRPAGPDGLPRDRGDRRPVGGPRADPLADLVRAQRLALAIAQARGLDPDSPRHLTRSVILT